MIDPSAFIAQGAIVLGDVELGKDASVWYNAVIRGDTDKITIGEETNIQDLTMIHTDPGISCVVGKRVTVGHRVILHGCTIEDDCLIGMGATVLDGARIGSQSIVGANSLVPQRFTCPAGSLVYGSPARIVRALTKKERGGLRAWARKYVAVARAHAALASGSYRSSVKKV